VQSFSADGGKIDSIDVRKRLVLMESAA
jgi:hypothetical protein